MTVGICVKNSEDTVAEAMDHVADQDFQHDLMELIIVDGCSHDRTIPIIRETLSKTDIPYKIFSENGASDMLDKLSLITPRAPT